MDPVPPDWAAKCQAHLPILVRQDALGDKISGVESVVSEVAAHRAAEGVGARLADGDQRYIARAALRRVKPARQELKLRNRIQAELRLAPRTHDIRDLRAVHVELIIGTVSGDWQA